MNYRLFLIVISVIVIAGCSGRTAFVSSVAAPGHVLSKSEPVYVFLPEDPVRAETEFYITLKKEMAAAGFNLVRYGSKAKYILTFKTGPGLIDMNTTFDLPAMSSSAGQVWGSDNYLMTSAANTYPQNIRYAVTRINLSLYATEETKANKMVKVWEGNVAAGEKDYNKEPGAVIKSLLAVFGTNYTAETEIDKYYQN